MGGGVKKVFDMLRGGGSKGFAACEGGGGASKKFDAENFQLPSPPHQSIYEHSVRVIHFFLSKKCWWFWEKAQNMLIFG